MAAVWGARGGRPRAPPSFLRGGVRHKPARWAPFGGARGGSHRLPLSFVPRGSMTDSFGFLVVTFIIILGFEAVNGGTDAPNSIATVISTRVLAPMAAVAMAAFFNLLGALSGTAVATTIGKGLVDQELVGLDTIAAAAAAGIIWGTAAWYLGVTTS